MTRIMVAAGRWLAASAVFAIVLASCGRDPAIQPDAPSPPASPVPAITTHSTPVVAPALPTPAGEVTQVVQKTATPIPDQGPPPLPAGGRPSDPTPTPPATATPKRNEKPFTLAVSPDPVPPRGTLTVEWTAPEGHSSSDRIAMFEVGASGEDKIQWRETDGATGGRVTFTAPAEVGQYEVRYLPEGAGDDAARTGFTAAYPPEAGEGYGVTATPSTVAPGEAITVAWTAPLWHSAHDSIALYQVGAADAEYLELRNIWAGADGSLVFAAPHALGEYEFRYLVNGVSPAASSSPVSATLPWCDDGYAVTASPDALGPGEALTVRWTSPPGQPSGAWIGLFELGSSNDDLLAREYTRGVSCGSVGFLTPGIPGRYELRYIGGGRNLSEGASNAVTVIPPAVLAAVPWVADGIEADEETAFELLLGIARAAPSVAATVAELAWSLDGVTPEERGLVRQLKRLAETDAGVASSVAGMGWLTDGVHEHEDLLVYRIALLAAHDPELALFTATVPWTTDGLSQAERDIVSSLASLAGLDLGLATVVAGLSWYADGITDDESAGVQNLLFLARKDPVMARRVVEADWFVEGISSAEASLVRSISELVLEDYALAADIVNNPLLAKELSESNMGALQQIDSLRQIDPGLADAALALPWIAEGVTDEDLWALVLLNALAKRDADLASTLLRVPWFAASMTGNKLAAVSLLSTVADWDAGLAFQVMSFPFFTISFEEHDVYALYTLYYLVRERLHGDLTLLTSQDWFADGLSDEEALFVAVLRAPARFALNEFRSLVADHHAETTTLSLPLGGEAGLRVFRMSAPTGDSTALEQLEEAVSVIEGFMGVPFPKSEVALLYASPGAPGSGRLAANSNTHLVVSPRYDDDSDVARFVVAHEVAHYYWGHDRSEGITVAQPWFVEGAAEFLADYVFDRLRDVPLRRFMEEAEEEATTDCIERGVTTLRQLIDPTIPYAQHESSPTFICNYRLGERFLLGIQDIIGIEALGLAFKDLYLLSRSDEHRGRQLTEREIYTAFLGHTSADSVNGFRLFYELWHGGDYAE